MIDTFKGAYEGGGADCVLLEVKEVDYSGGNMAAERSRFTMYDKDGKVVMQGK